MPNARRGAAAARAGAALLAIWAWRATTVRACCTVEGWQKAARAPVRVR